MYGSDEAGKGARRRRSAAGIAVTNPKAARRMRELGIRSFNDLAARIIDAGLSKCRLHHVASTAANVLSYADMARLKDMSWSAGALMVSESLGIPPAELFDDEATGHLGHARPETAGPDADYRLKDNRNTPLAERDYPKAVMAKLAGTGLNSIRRLGQEMALRIGGNAESHMVRLTNLLNGRDPRKCSDGTWRRTAVDLAEFLGCLPEELFDEEDIDPPDLNAIADDILDVEITRLSDNESSATPEELMMGSERGDLVREALGHLSPRAERVLRMRYGLHDGREMTLDEVGIDFNVSRERIRQIEAKAIRRLKVISMYMRRQGKDLRGCLAGGPRTAAA